jgi:LL-diaminopimelate aminotransferase
MNIGKMVKRNPNLAKLPAGYLFPEINKRRRLFLKEHPEASIISLGVGNTTEPLTPHIAEGLTKAAELLGTPGGYSGYGDEQGQPALRARISETLYRGRISPDEVFISDGAKCDIGRLQAMFGPHAKVAVQDPSYPVYVDGSVIAGASGKHSPRSGHFAGITYLECTPENGFFPDLRKAPKSSVLYFCSPNNPTGAVSDRRQLAELVSYARKSGSIIVYDAAYSEYIRDKSLPKSIYEIEGAPEVAIEISSFSKFIGFTGVRLGWSVVPKALAYSDGKPVIDDWNRMMTTLFNGASNIAQAGGLAALDPEGLKEMGETIGYYMENARIIREALDRMSVESYGGTNSPYIWSRFPARKSWDVFEEILAKAHVVTTPGSGFGPAGEGYIRFSAFGHREAIGEAARRLREGMGGLRLG